MTFRFRKRSITLILTAVLLTAAIPGPFIKMRAEAAEPVSADAGEFSGPETPGNGEALDTKDSGVPGTGESGLIPDFPEEEGEILTESDTDADPDVEQDSLEDQISFDEQTSLDEEETVDASEGVMDEDADETEAPGEDAEAYEQNPAETSDSMEESAESSLTGGASGESMESGDPQDLQGLEEPVQEDTEHPVLTADGVLEEVVPVENGAEDTDNEDVFAAYVNRELGLDGDLKADTGDYAVSTPRMKKNYASNSLSGYNLKIYQLLLKQIRQIAAGERQDTVLTVSLDDLGLKGKSWTAAELGVDAIVKDKAITEESTKALTSLLGVSFKDINSSLLHDCPYDLYWYDKTASSFSKGFKFTASYLNGEYTISYSVDSVYTFEFPVAAEYSLSVEEGAYEINPVIGASVRGAREKALSIVDKYDGKTDYEKLDGYRKEICDLTSYNYDAAKKTDTAYGNPWQLIWVFDDDPTTAVVCEGYAKSFQYLCDLSSFDSIYRECISVTGSLDGGTGAGGHMWNVVTLRDGRSYLVDLTNCDSDTIGSGSSGRNLFLVGTGDTSDSKVFAQGSLETGYTFAQLKGLSYTYDENALARFDEKILTLAPGRVDAGTVLADTYSGFDHDHIYYPLEEVTPTCQHKGHSAGTECIICGKYDDSVEIYPKTDHIPGEWEQILAPTYEREGEEKRFCAVCGVELDSRSIDKLVRTNLADAVKNGTAAAEITSPASSLVYTGKAVTPAVKVTYQGVTLQQGTDYALDGYSSNINAGTNTASVRISGQGDYTGTLSIPFSIGKAATTITAKTSASAVAVQKTLSVKVTGAKGKTSFASYNTNIAAVSGTGVVTGKKVGTVKIKVTSAETANYKKAETTVTVKVLPAATSTLTAANLASGIKVTWARVTGATGYILYRNNTAVKTFSSGANLTFTDTKAAANGGKYVYKLVAKGSTGTSTLSRSVTVYRLSRPAIRTLKNSAAKRMTLTWAKNAKGNGYVLQYSEKSNFSKYKTVTITNASTVSRTITGLTKNKTWYVRIRTRKKSGSSTWYSTWSTVKKIKITR